MSPRVTAILVVTDGARDAAHLRATLDALAASTRVPDRIIAVAMGSPAPVVALLQAAAIETVVTLRDRQSYGSAVRAAIAAVPDDPALDPEREAYWLLAQDTVPAPDALAQLVGALELSPSVGVVGPKLLAGEARDTIVSLGETMTQYGATVEIVGTELDQGQYDTESDVLAVATPGLLVRRGAWERVGGIDPALERADDGLDFGTRVRLAGFRVSVAPQARVYWYGDGVAGPSRSRRGAIQRRQAGASRYGQLHRRLVYARGPVLWLQWLGIIPTTLFRIFWRLVNKQPELIAPETAASLRALVSLGRVSRSRALFQESRSAPWSAIRELRMPTSEVRRRSRLRKEANAVTYEVERTELNFIGGGGGWLVIGSLLVSLVLFFGLLGATAVTGGGLLPLSGTVSELWNNAVYGWRDLGAGFFGAADPFAAVLAFLGTLTFWNPSFSLVLLYLLALPLSTLGGWFAATRLTERSGYRLVFAVLWTLAPSLLGSLAAGEPAGIIVHILLPWFAYAVVIYRRSWAATGAASILLAAIVASAPVLAVPAALIWLVLVFTSWRMFPRTLWLILPTIALFFPLIWQQGVQNGNWWALLADPGASVIGQSGTLGWRIALGHPGFDLSGWPGLIEGLGVSGITAEWILPILLAPLAVIALSALFLRGSFRAVALLVVALLGLVTAVAAGQIAVSFSGTEALTLWPGPGLSLYWLGLVGAAIVGLDSMRRVGMIPAIVMVVASVLVALPMAATFVNGGSTIHASTGRTMPALVAATASSDPGVGTLVIRPEGAQSVSATIVRGPGVTLDSRSTLDSTRLASSESDHQLAELTGNLVATSGLDPSAALSEFGIQFVLVSEPAAAIDSSAKASAIATATQAATALDANPALSRVGDTDQGVLWRFDVGGTDAHAGSAGWPRTLNILALIVIFGIAVLLSVPTENSRRISEGSPRTVGQTRIRTAASARSGRRAQHSPDRSSRRAQAQAQAKAAAEADAELGAALAAEPETSATAAPEESGAAESAPIAVEPAPIAVPEVTEAAPETPAAPIIAPEGAAAAEPAPPMLHPADPETAQAHADSPEQILHDVAQSVPEQPEPVVHEAPAVDSGPVPHLPGIPEDTATTAEGAAPAVEPGKE